VRGRGPVAALPIQVASPEQIVGRLRLEFPDDPEMMVSI